MVDDSSTMDEQNHLTRGLTFLASGDPRFSLEHPPLINLISALPVAALLDVVIPFDLPYWEWREGWYGMADFLFWRAGNNPHHILFLGRLPILFLTMGLGLTGYHFARQLWGKNRLTGLTALVFLLFDPNILAHGRYSSTDLGGALFVTLAFWALWRMWRADGWRVGRAGLSALMMGLAFGSKLSALIFVPIWLGLATLPLFDFENERRAAWRRLNQTVVAGLASIVVVWAIFGFEWGRMAFQSEALQRLNQYAGAMPTFFAGIEQILFLSGGGRPSYLNGNFSNNGFYAYFPVAFAVKTPLLALALFISAALFAMANSSSRKRALFLLLPAAAYFAVTVGSAINIGYRHLLPILPLLYLLVPALIAYLKVKKPAWMPAVGLVAGLFLANTLSIHPHYLSYFNRLGGGAANGGRILIDSNIDWGQDLARLQQWMTENGEPSVKLSYFGSANPAAYLKKYQPLPGLTHHHELWWDLPFDPKQPEPGIYAISVSNLFGEIPLQILEEKTVFAYFRARLPDDRIGYSIWIYRVEAE